MQILSLLAMSSPPIATSPNSTLPLANPLICLCALWALHGGLISCSLEFSERGNDNFQGLSPDTGEDTNIGQSPSSGS
jgi:hypothetical protein